MLIKTALSMTICTLTFSCTSALKDANYPQQPPFENVTSKSEKNTLFGKLKYSPWFGKGPISITNEWDKNNLVKVFLPQLQGINTYASVPHSGHIQINKNIEIQYKMLWHAWEQEGVLEKVISWGGGYAPRKVRGSYLSLSNHAYGTAFDINYNQNSLGNEPARKSEKGSVYELVGIAHEHGFYWGGHFSRKDGMHFEVAKKLSANEIENLAIKYKYSDIRVFKAEK